MTGLNRVLVLAVAIVAFCWGCSSSETFSPTPEGIAQYLARNGLGVVDTSGTPWELDRIPREECALAFPDPFDSSKDFMLILPNKYGILYGLPNDNNSHPDPAFVAVPLYISAEKRLTVDLRNGLSLGHTTSNHARDAISARDYPIYYRWDKGTNSFVVTTKP